MDLGRADEWNALAQRVNALWNLRGVASGVRVSLTESGGTIEIDPSISDDGLTGLDSIIKDFIHVGKFDLTYRPGEVPEEYAWQRIRKWNDPGEVFIVPDFVGGIGNWDPDVTGDYAWRVQLKSELNFSIDAIEMYIASPHDDGHPEWVTGQAWSTRATINATEYQPPYTSGNSTNAAPLKVYAGGSPYGSGVAINSDYAEVLSGAMFAGGETHTLYLFGNVGFHQVAAAEFFRVMIFTRNESIGEVFPVAISTIDPYPVDPPTENG